MNSQLILTQMLHIDIATTIILCFFFFKGPCSWNILIAIYYVLAHLVFL